MLAAYRAAAKPRAWNNADWQRVMAKYWNCNEEMRWKTTKYEAANLRIGQPDERTPLGISVMCASSRVYYSL